MFDVDDDRLKLETFAELSSRLAPPEEPPRGALTYVDIMRLSNMNMGQAKTWAAKQVENGDAEKFVWKGRAYFVVVEK